MVEGADVENKHREGAREIARMKERDKVEFKRKRAEMFPGWGNHSEI